MSTHTHRHAHTHPHAHPHAHTHQPQTRNVLGAGVLLYIGAFILLFVAHGKPNFKFNIVKILFVVAVVADIIGVS